jgi:hypothetical protein
VAAVGYFPESNLRGSGKEDVLGAVGDKLHKSSTHAFAVIYLPEKIFLDKIAKLNN